MSESPFPKRLASQQLDLLRAIYAGMVEAGNWPTFAYIDKVLDRKGLEINEVASTLPRGLTNVSVRPLNPSEEATLTIAGLSYVPEARRDLALFLAVLGRAVEAERKYEPEPGKADGPELTSDELEADLQITSSDVKRLRLITQFEPWIGSSGFTQEGRWNFRVTREARRYREIRSIEQYVAMRQEAYQNAYGAVPPVRVTRPHTIPQPHGLYPSAAPQPAVDAVLERRIFVIMPFAKRMNPVYAAIKEACDEIGIPCKRSDEIVEVGKITEQIYEALQDADAIIADITGRNPNVMYELGYAHALKKAVILLNSGGSAPFDVADYRQIRYRMDDLAAARASMIQFLRSTLRLDE